MASKSSISRIKIGLNVLVQSVLFLVLFAVANYLGFNHYKRWDFSRDQKYTLSPQTRQVLSNLKKPVHLIVYFSGGSPVATDATNLLKEYNYASKKMVDVAVVDPFHAMSQAREIATQYKLRDNDNVVIVDYDGHSKFVPAASMAEFEPTLSPTDKPRMKTFKGEAALTQAIIEITESGSNQTYTLSGHGEISLETDPAVSGLKDYIERQNVKLSPLKLTDVENVPPDAKVLFIIAPRYDFSDVEIHSLRAYWERQGRLFVFLEPNTPTPKLAAFLSEIGIIANDDRVLTIRKVLLEGGVGFGVLKEITGDFVTGSPITKRLTSVTANLGGGATQSLTLDAERGKTSGIELKPLIQASKGFWGEIRYSAEDIAKGVFFDPKEDHINPIVAVSAEKGALADAVVPINSSRMLVVGSAAFLSNKTITEADMDFFLNGLNWLLDREKIIGIAPKTVRTLSVTLADSQMRSIFSLVILAIPGTAAAIGIAVWLKRRR